MAPGVGRIRQERRLIMPNAGKEKVHLTLSERDRRYAAIRERLREGSVDCVITTGSNLFYLTNGLPGERFGLLPTEEGTPLTAVIHRRYFVDLSPQVLVDSQDWVKDLRSGIDASPLVEKIEELRLEKGTIGVTGSKVGYGGLSHGFYRQLEKALPGAKVVDVSDVFADVRTLKSGEEVRMIEEANRVFDAAIERVHEVARPGMIGAEVVQEGIKAMWAAGGDMESTFFFTFGPVPQQNPVLARLGLHRRIREGDMGTLTAHSEYGHYAGHTDQEISFGKPKSLHQEMFEGVLHIRDAVLKQVKDGVTQRELLDTYQTACRATGFNSSPHSQIHQYGIDVPEFPGPAFGVSDAQGGKGLGGGGNFVLKSGMIYSISPTLVANDGEDTLLGGTSLVVTDDGYRELSDRKVELLVA